MEINGTESLETLVRLAFCKLFKEIEIEKTSTLTRVMALNLCRLF